MRLPCLGHGLEDVDVNGDANACLLRLLRECARKLLVSSRLVLGRSLRLFLDIAYEYVNECKFRSRDYEKGIL